MPSNTSTSEPTALDCKADPIGALKTMFVDQTIGPRLQRGQAPARRPVFLKQHGVARGRFELLDSMPAEFRVGLFASGTSFPAWIRFSSDTVPMLRDLKTTVGVGIKLFDVPLQKLIGNPADRTFDFVLQNHDVFFVDDAVAMCEFTKASFEGHDQEYLREHPTTDQILADMQHEVESVLSSSYWSVLPYRFGNGRLAKYKLEVESAPASDGPTDKADPNYLAADLHSRVLKGETRFRFLIQFQTTDAEMPLDRATVRWSEEVSAPVQVATLIIPSQDVNARGQSEYGENLAFNPWRVSGEHEPQGSVADARRVIYQASSELRRAVNGIADGEPIHAREAVYYPQAKDTEIVSAKIHPAIGIARVGNSPDEYFIGPETSTPLPSVPGDRRDATGALKRQAARFRIYGYNRAGEAVAELTAESARIEWGVEVANLKATWYQFQIALDIPEAATADPSQRRNKDYPDRASLAIRPSRQTIIAPEPTPAILQGTFAGQSVYLGEAFTDDDGHLIVLGGHGKAGSVGGAQLTTFANNDGWYDDVCDGAVTANVTIGGKDLPVDPAWVVVAPPNYAPDLKSVRTLYDLLKDVFIDAGSMKLPTTVSFVHDILPIFQRLAGLQWVNAGFATGFGHGGVTDLMSPDFLGRLADPSDAAHTFRYDIFNSFRDFDKDGWSPSVWPWLYGDAMEIPFAQTPRQNTMLAKNQMYCLKQWADGNFESDLPGSLPEPDSIEKLALADRPAMLDRAALEFCLADAFHPGCEVTWPMRHSTLYMAPFRVKHRRSDEVIETTGDVLSPFEVLRSNGHLYGQRPGWLTRWMAIPWHADTASCRSQADYGPDYSPFVPTFWPARVPNQVLSQADYSIVSDPSRTRQERLEAFKRRTDWVKEGLGDSDYLTQIRAMLTNYPNLGLVELRKGVEGDVAIPAAVYVSDGKLPQAAGPTLQATVITGDFKERLGNFPFGSPE